jgi:hypothetical protein
MDNVAKHGDGFHADELRANFWGECYDVMRGSSNLSCFRISAVSQLLCGYIFRKLDGLGT